MTKLNVTIKRIVWSWIAEVGPEITWKSDKQTNLIQMENGYGKTTTLELLVGVFTGILPDGKTLRTHLAPKGPDRHLHKGEKGKFEVTLHINGEETKIGIDIDHKKKQASFYTVSVSGHDSGWKPPEDFQSAFQKNEALTRLFILNAEMADSINADLGAGPVKKAIMKLGNLDPIESLCSEDGHLDEWYNRKLVEKNLTGSKTQLVQTTNALKNSKKHRIAIKGDVKNLKNDLKGLAVEEASLQEDYDEILKDAGISKEVKEMEKELKNLEDKVKQDAEHMLESLIDPRSLPQTFWEEIKDYYASLQEKKIPGPAREWFIDIANDSECICGEEMTNKRQANILDGVEGYLSDETQSVVLSIRSDVREATRIKSLESDNVALSKSAGNVAKQKTAIKRKIKSKNSGIDPDEEQRIKDRMKEIDIENDNANELIRRHEEKNLQIIKQEGLGADAINEDSTYAQTFDDIETCQNLWVIDKCIKELEKKQANLADIMEVKRSVDLMKEIIESTQKSVVEEVTQHTITLANTNISRVHPQGGVEIKEIGDSIVLANPTDEDQEGANQALNLTITYSIVESLLSIADIKTPMVLDSPSNPFSNRTARRFCKFLEKTTGQMILLIQSSEKDNLRPLWKDKADVSRCTILRNDETLGQDDDFVPKGSMMINWDSQFFEDYDAGTN